MSCGCLGPEGYLTTLGNQGDLAIELWWNKDFNYKQLRVKKVELGGAPSQKESLGTSADCTTLWKPPSGDHESVCVTESKRFFSLFLFCFQRMLPTWMWQRNQFPWASKLRSRQQHTSFSGACAWGLSASRLVRNMFFICVKSKWSAGWRYSLNRASMDKR